MPKKHSERKRIHQKQKKKRFRKTISTTLKLLTRSSNNVTQAAIPFKPKALTNHCKDWALCTTILIAYKCFKCPSSINLIMLPKAVMVPHIFTSPNYIFAVYTVFFLIGKRKYIQENC